MVSNFSKTTAPGGESRQSLRHFLVLLEPQERCAVAARREDYLLSAMVEQLEGEKRFPVVELTDPDTGGRTVCNIFASRDRLKRVIHHVTDVEEQAERFQDLEFVDSGGCDGSAGFPPLRGGRGALYHLRRDRCPGPGERPL